MSVEMRELGEAIRAARMRKGLTQEALSELLDITPIHLKNIESSRRKPSVPLLFSLMRLLDFSVDALVFPERGGAGVIHTDGLPEAEAEALARLADAMRQTQRNRN
ncbi:MAG: helix-turn-helix transcriptional regulator [Oscillibacter sp.]|nr:helix-turn-helix transcriptional regulator [Oscillibacter sp.]